MNKILVTGATGQLGTAVIKTLLIKMPAEQISIITRDEGKRQAFQDKGFNACLGNYADLDSLEKAMQDVDTVLLISSGDQGDRMQEHKNVVDTAKRTGVKRIAYTSRSLRDRSSLANKLMTEHFETEDYIFASGLEYIIFRNALYMDALPQFIGGRMALEKGIHLPAGNGRVAFALRAEMGEAMARVLTEKSGQNQIINLTANQAYSFAEVAAALGRLSGKEVNYTDTDEITFAGMMKNRNLPEPMIQKILDFIRDIRENQEAETYSDLEDLLERKPASLEGGLKLLFDL